MNTRRLALVAALTLTMVGFSHPARAGWENPDEGPVSNSMSADLDMFVQVSATSLAVVRAAL
jgi:hypothetical protein